MYAKNSCLSFFNGVEIQQLARQAEVKLCNKHDNTIQIRLCNNSQNQLIRITLYNNDLPGEAMLVLYYNQEYFDCYCIVMFSWKHCGLQYTTRKTCIEVTFYL